MGPLSLPAAGSGLLLGGWRTGSSRTWTTSTWHGPPTGSKLWPASCWLDALSNVLIGPPPDSRPPLAVGGDSHSSCAQVLFYVGLCPAAGSGLLLAAEQSAKFQATSLADILPFIPTSPTGKPVTSPALAAQRRSHTPAALDKTPTLGYRGGRYLHGVGYSWAPFGGMAN